MKLALDFEIKKMYSDYNVGELFTELGLERK